MANKPADQNAPLTAFPPIKRKPGCMRYPQSTKQREELINKTLKEFLMACPVIDRNDPVAIANMRAAIADMSSSKLMYLHLSAETDSPPSDAAIMANVKKMRMTHDGCRGWDTDSTFQFFRGWLRRGKIEMLLEVKALEVVHYAISRRDENDKPILDSAAREMALAVLEHFGWTKEVAPSTTVNNYIATPGEIDKEKREKFEELARLAQEDENAARIIEAMKRRKHGEKKVSPLAVGVDGELKKAENAS